MNLPVSGREAIFGLTGDVEEWSREMKRNALLEQIWRGAVSLFDAGEPGVIARGVMALLPVRTISLRNAGRHDLPRILSEAEELRPGLTLGDVLAEELGIEVPYGALVVFEEVGETVEPEGKSSMDAALGYLVGSAAEGSAIPSRRGAAEIAAAFRDGGLNARFFGERPLAAAEKEAAQTGPR